MTAPTLRRPLGRVVPVRDLRHPLTGPIAMPPIPTSGPAHWHPQYEEPIYAGVYAERREQLLAGLRSGTIGEAVPA
jgi:hypothetical protein